MRKIQFIFFLIFLIGLSSVSYSETLVVKTVGNQTYSFEVEIADTAEKAARGLMYRSSIPSNSGMLFISKESRIWSMWMKNTQVPLDMLFFDEMNEIVYIKENASPYSLDIISYPFPVKGVLELKGGIVKELGIKLGDQLIY